VQKALLLLRDIESIVLNGSIANLKRTNPHNCASLQDQNEKLPDPHLLPPLSTFEIAV
jgi:hypothetical protein